MDFAQDEETVVEVANETDPVEEAATGQTVV